MDQFLRSVIEQLKKLDQFKVVNVVLSNDSCDLDTTVSTLTAAYFNQQSLKEEEIIVPVLNVTRQTFALKSEIIFFLEETDLSPKLLICKDEIDIEKLHNEAKLKLTLVGHQNLPSELKHLEKDVVSIIDHKPLAAPIKNCNINVQEMGACSTLITEMILKQGTDTVDPQIALLLYGTILLTTHCLGETTCVTPMDHLMVNQLEPLLEGVSREEVYQVLKKAKQDITGLSVNEIIGKELRYIAGGGTKLAFSTLSVSLEDLVSICPPTTCLEATLKQFSSQLNCSLLLLLVPTRQMAIYSSKATFVQKVAESLIKQGVALEPLAKSSANLQMFSQAHSTPSLVALFPNLLQELNCPPTITTGLSEDVLEQNVQSHTPYLLGVSGESLSSGSSAQNSCPYTPQNSFIEDYFVDVNGKKQTEVVLPTFNSREMIEKIEHKRKNLRDYETETPFNSIKTIPFTPKNSFIDGEPDEENLDQEQLLKKVQITIVGEHPLSHPLETNGSMEEAAPLSQQPHGEPEEPPSSPKNKNLKKKSRNLSALDQEEDEEDSNWVASERSKRKNRPNTVTGKLKKISVNMDMFNIEPADDEKSLSSVSGRSEVFSSLDDLATPDDMTTPNDLEDSTLTLGNISDPIPEWSASEEFCEERNWKTCTVCGIERKIDMKVIEPYKKVLSHGGYTGSTRQAIIVFGACYLPDRSRKDYDYVMDNLFFYVLVSLDQLVAEDYILLYLHGATRRSNMPSFRWLKRCYQMIDRRLRKNLKGLYLVHPTFWLKTLVIMTRPFISSKFRRKLRFVNNLHELSLLIPLEHVAIPEKVKLFDDQRMQDS